MGAPGNKGTDRDAKKTIGEDEPDDPGGRSAYFLSSREGAKRPKRPKKVILEGSRNRRALERELQLDRDLKPSPPDKPLPPGGAGSVNWTPIGPSAVPHGQASGAPPVSGRVRSLAVGPAAARVYAGAANGGVWLTTDSGTSWRPLDDYATSPGTTSGLAADSLSVGGLAVRFGATQATDTLYVGTGEPSGGDAYFGVGVKRSTSGGAPGSWTLEATNLAGRAFFRVAIDPDDPAIVLGATSAGLFRRPASGSAASWTQITSPAFPGVAATDVIVAGTGATRRYYVAFSGGAVFTSTDLSSWTALTGGGLGGRVTLAAGESDPDAVYALASNGVVARKSGSALQTVAGIPQALFFGGQGSYDMFLAVDPANANTIFFGGDIVDDGDWTLSMYKGTITGGPGTWTFPFNAANDVHTDAAGNRFSDLVPNDPTWVGRGIHGDGHAIAFAVTATGTGHDATHVWVGCDGGVFASSMGGARGTFTARNAGLAITELEYLAQRGDTDAVVFAGAQDNGTLRAWGEQAWTEVQEGDGGGTAVDTVDQYRVMRQYIRTSLAKSDDGGSSGWVGAPFPPRTSSTTAQNTAANTEKSATSFYGPIAVTPAGVSPSLTAFGTNRVWVTPDFAAWVTLPTATNPYVPATPDAGQDVLDGAAVRGLDFATGTRLYASTASAVWRFDKSGSTWTRTALTTTGLPASRFITDIAADSSGNVYATLGWSGVNHLWYFDGTTWTAAGPAATVLDVPCHAVATDPANPAVVFLGSDVGCWRGVKAGLTWTWAPFSQGLPECAITDLGVHARTRLLRAATHGRGAWEYPLDATTGSDPDIYMRANYADTGRLTGGTRAPWIEGAQDPTRKGWNVAHWLSADIKVRRPSLAGLPTLNSPPNFLDYAANIGDYRDSITHNETADISGTNRAFVEVHNRGLTPIPGAMVRVLLLITDAHAGLPALPEGFETRINSNDTSNWVAGSAWRFADPSAPYRTLPGPLDARVPQVVEFPLNVSSLSLPAGHDHVCAAAFITTAGDPITSTDTSLDSLTMHDKHVVHRNLHLVNLGATPSQTGGTFDHQPVTIALGFHNSGGRARSTDLVFDRSQFPGDLWLMLPRGATAKAKLVGLSPQQLGRVSAIRDHLFRFLEEHGGSDELGPIDRKQVLFADPKRAAVRGVRIPPGRTMWSVITLRAPVDARPGDFFRFDASQLASRRTVGGSSYVMVVREPLKG